MVEFMIVLLVISNIASWVALWIVMNWVRGAHTVINLLHGTVKTLTRRK